MSISTLSPRERSTARHYARTAEREDAKGEQARRAFANDCCVWSGGAWVYPLPRGGTTADLDAALAQWRES